MADARAGDVRVRLSRFGARLGNWNDRHSSHDRRSDASLRWRFIDRLARWMFVKGDGFPRPTVDELTALWDDEGYFG